MIRCMCAVWFQVSRYWTNTNLSTVFSGVVAEKYSRWKVTAGSGARWPHLSHLNFTIPILLYLLFVFIRASAPWHVTAVSSLASSGSDATVQRQPLIQELWQFHCDFSALPQDMPHMLTKSEATGTMSKIHRLFCCLLQTDSSSDSDLCYHLCKCKRYAERETWKLSIYTTQVRSTKKVQTSYLIWGYI